MKNKFSILALFLVVITVLFFNFYEPPGHLIAWDQFGYYLYLPLIFIYHDLGMKNFSVVENLIHSYQPIQYFYQGIQLTDGSYALRYTSGLAILYSPGFFIGHLYAYLFNYPMDGFSPPYQYAILCWSVLFLLIGLYYFRLLLLYFFSDKITAIVLLVFYFGTNFLHMTTHWGILLVHTYLFTVFTIMLWHTIKWHAEHRFSSAIIIGITLGLSAIIRPTEVLSIIIPVLWGIKNVKDLKQKISSVFRNYLSHLIAAAAIIFLFACIQLGYWKNITGYFFFDSYGANAGEGFDFPPYLLQFLFSYRKGWLLYTPVMAFALSGFIYIYKNKRELFLSLFSFFILFLLVVSSWTYWWYATCFSQRTMIQIYPLLCIALGFFIQWCFKWKNILRIGSGILILFLMFLNLFQIWQYSHGIIDGDRMTNKYYWKVFFKTSVPTGADSLLLVSRDSELKNEKLLIKKTIFSNDFEKDKQAIKNISFRDTTINFSSTTGKIDSASEFFNLYDEQLKNLSDKYFFWVRIKMKIMPLLPIKTTDAMLVINILHNNKAYQYSTFPFVTDTSHLYIWHELKADYLTPEIRSYNDRLQVYVWNGGKGMYVIDDLSIEMFEPPENP